ncbi:MAG TPA: DUF2304 domain-containing protein [Thermodesulfovibrionales bacterium]|nr:DUF2304 domain-containing protein [Thermodesulfovibrionales bacterium]
MDMVTLMATLVALAIVFSVVELIRRNKLKEKYSLLWLGSSLVILFFSASRKALESISLFVGIYYPPSFIFLLAFLFLIVINIHFSTVISALFERNKSLSQEIALLKEAMKEGESRNE